MSTPQQPAANPQPANANGKRKRLMALLVVVILIAAVAYGLYYFLDARFHESTDDAYVNGNVVQITPQVTGTVVAVKADDTQTVKAGDPLVVLDPADARVALEQAEANLAQTVRQVRGLFADDSQYEAQVAQRESDLKRAQDDLHRRMQVAQTGAVSQEEISHARDAVASAQAALNAAEQQLAANRALTANTTISTHPNVMSAAAKVRDAYLANARNVLPAPVDGYVAKRSVQVGQRVSPGTPLMSVVPLNAVWVDANFKEVQLNHMRIGQPVEMTADVYGSSVVYHGKVVGFSAGTGSAFSLLPAQNATGNWIKIVQRVPVRIALDANELHEHPLRIGLSMNATIDTHDRSGPALTTLPDPKAIASTAIYAPNIKSADALVARIIADNLGRK